MNLIDVKMYTRKSRLAFSVVDINECGVDNGGCSEVCENTDGSFFCACDGDEKALSSDGKSCVGTCSLTNHLPRLVHFARDVPSRPGMAR